MKVYRLKKDWGYGIGNGSNISFRMDYKEGDRFFKPTDISEYKTIGPTYFPENGSYGVSERENFKFVDEYFEFVEETDKPIEYFTQKIYTEYQLQEILKSKQ